MSQVWSNPHLHLKWSCFPACNVASVVFLHSPGAKQSTWCDANCSSVFHASLLTPFLNPRRRCGRGPSPKPWVSLPGLNPDTKSMSGWVETLFALLAPSAVELFLILHSRMRPIPQCLLRNPGTGHAGTAEHRSNSLV